MEYWVEYVFARGIKSGHPPIPVLKVASAVQNSIITRVNIKKSLKNEEQKKGLRFEKVNSI